MRYALIVGLAETTPTQDLHDELETLRSRLAA
jgi:hypothetical protein